MPPTSAAPAPACPSRAQQRGSVVHARAFAAPGTNPHASDFNPKTSDFNPKTPDFNPKTYDDLLLRHTGAFRRLYVIVSIIILEILQRMAMMDNPNLQPLPSTVLARAMAGDTFGLPAPLAATLRLLARQLRRWVEPQAHHHPSPQPAPQSGVAPQHNAAPRFNAAHQHNAAPLDDAARHWAAPRRPAASQIRVEIRATTGPPGHAGFFQTPKPRPHLHAQNVPHTKRTRRPIPEPSRLSARCKPPRPPPHWPTFPASPIPPPMRRHRRTRIVATLGPATSAPDMLARLFEAGADVFRLNFSHGTHQDHAARIQSVRALEKSARRPIAILADIQGPKLRVGKFGAGRVQLRTGQKFRLDLDPTSGDALRVQLPHPEIIAAAAIGTTLLLDDGKLRLRVARVRPTHLETEVVVGGLLSDRKGVNVPDVVLPIPALTAKDRADLDFVLPLGIDYIGLSFVQRPEDVAQAREIAAGRAAILSKLEKPQALDQLDAILDLSDAVMVARGDLGVELPPEEVPLAQKRIVRAARRLGKPVVVATQMLESMISAPAPTRAEASDVATAVFDGADAVMLSAETASGQYPVEAVTIMDRIIARVEQDPGWRAQTQASRPPPESRVPDAIAAAAGQVAHTIGASAIVAFTSSGNTALRVARERPDCPIIGMTPDIAVARRLALVWGVHAIRSETQPSMTKTVESAVRAARLEGFAVPGQYVVVTAGVPFAQSGTTNALRVARA